MSLTYDPSRNAKMPTDKGWARFSSDRLEYVAVLDGNDHIVCVRYKETGIEIEFTLESREPGVFEGLMDGKTTMEVFDAML